MSRPALVPELYVTNLEVSLEFYVGVLGFVVDYDRPENGFAAVSLGQAHLMLEETKSLTAASDDEFTAGQWRSANLEYPFGRGMSLEITVPDVDAVFAGVNAHGYPVKLPLHERWYRREDDEVGVRQFLVMDPDGFLLRLEQSLGVRPLASP